MTFIVVVFVLFSKMNAIFALFINYIYMKVVLTIPD